VVAVEEENLTMHRQRTSKPYFLMPFMWCL